MNRRAKASVAAVLGVGCLLGAASPSQAAGQAVARDSITFTYEGQQLTCAVFGGSELLRTSGAVIFYDTHMDDPDPRCGEALLGTESQAEYRRGEGSETAVAYGHERARGAVDLDTPVDEVVVRHTATFACDSNPYTGCRLDLVTRPK